MFFDFFFVLPSINLHILLHICQHSWTPWQRFISYFVTFFATDLIFFYTGIFCVSSQLSDIYSAKINKAHGQIACYFRVNMNKSTLSWKAKIFHLEGKPTTLFLLTIIIRCFFFLCFNQIFLLHFISYWRFPIFFKHPRFIFFSFPQFKKKYFSPYKGYFIRFSTFSFAFFSLLLFFIFFFLCLFFYKFTSFSCFTHFNSF